jgi:hypothetical protein
MRLALPLTLLLCLIGCAHVDPFDHLVQNHTAQRLTLYQVGADGTERLVAEIAPGLTYPLNLGDRCTTSDLVVRTGAGAEVARRTEPLCKSDTWVVNDPAPSS